MLSIKNLQKELSEKGWKSIKKHPDFKTIVSFDIIDEEKSWYSADWFLLVKEVKKLDKKAADRITKQFNDLESQKTSFTKANVIFMFIIASDVDPKAAETLCSQEPDINKITLKGMVAGRILAIDLKKNILYGTLPLAPMDARLKISHIKDSIEKVLARPLNYADQEFSKITPLFILSVVLMIAGTFLVLLAFIMMLFFSR